MKRWPAICVWLLILGGLAGTFASAFRAMWIYHWFPAWNSLSLGLYDRLVEGDSYYTHAPLVLVVSGLITWLLLRHTRVPIRSSPVRGGLVLAGSLILQLLSCFIDVQFVQGFAFVGVVAGIVLCVWGAAALRRLWFPIALLVFMMPLPPMLIAEMNFRLKMLAADWGVGFANLIGIASERAGSRILLDADKEMVVGSVCSGLRTLISLFAFGAIYAYVCRLRGWWRLALFSMTVPVAIVSNCLRISSLIVVAHFTDVATATGWYHDASGVLVFLLAFLLMFGLEKLVLLVRAWMGVPAKITGLFPDVRRGPEDRGQGLAILRSAGTGSGILAALMLLAAAWGVQLVSHYSAPAGATAMVRDSLPLRLQVGSAAVTGKDLELDERTLTILQTHDYVYRKYEAPQAEPVDLCITCSRGNRRGSHPPDFCLEGGGRSIVAKNAVAIPGVGGGAELPCRELITQTGTQREYYLYTYRCGSTYTSNWYYQQVSILGNSLLGRNPNGALIRLSTPLRGDDLPEARQRLAEFMQSVVPHLEDAFQ
jgi:EpsI family protein